MNFSQKQYFKIIQLYQKEEKSQLFNKKIITIHLFKQKNSINKKEHCGGVENKQMVL